MDPNTTRDILVNYVGGVAATVTTAGAGLAIKKYHRALRARLGEAISELLQTALPQARDRMAANSGAFLDHVAGELAARDSEDATAADGAGTVWIADALTDPATAVSFHAALLAASQTSSEQRHAMLAKLVVTRLAAETDSGRAAESAFAVEASARLGREHLYVLGVLALVRHVGRLPVIALPPDVSETYTHYTEPAYSQTLDALRPRAPLAATPFVASFATWSKQHGIGRLASQTDVLHLASAGCLATSGTALQFREAIAPPDELLPQESGHPHHAYVSWVTEQVERQLREDSAGALLLEVWERSLAYLAPTPAGILIGLAVHDAVTGESQVRRWEWAPDDARPWHPGVRPWIR